MPITIPAQVVNGHLQHEKSLPELEGQYVLATLTIVPPGATVHGQEQTEKPPQENQEHVLPADWQKIRVKLDSMKTLENGWDSYRAPAPSPDAIRQAAAFLEDAAKSETALSRLAPSVVGGVGFTFKRRNLKVYVEFRNTGSVHALFSDGVTDPIIEKIQPDPANYVDLLARTKKYLYE